MTEALRDYLEERFVKVRSGYGASDLTIGMAGETDLSVWLRRRLRTDAALRAALLGPDEHRLPMVFQYNPLETYLETDADNEIALHDQLDGGAQRPRCATTSATRAGCARSPRCWPRSPTRPRGPRRERAWRGRPDAAAVAVPVRAQDSTISYMGANIYPQDVEYGLYDDNPLAHLLAGFCLELRGAAGPGVAGRSCNLQLRAGRRARRRTSGRSSPTRAATACCAHLAAVSRDFAESLRRGPVGRPTCGCRCTTYGTGPFAGTDTEDQERLPGEGSAPHEDRATSPPRRRWARRPRCSSAAPVRRAAGRSSR